MLRPDGLCAFFPLVSLTLRHYASKRVQSLHPCADVWLDFGIMGRCTEHFRWRLTRPRKHGMPHPRASFIIACSGNGDVHWSACAIGARKEKPHGLGKGLHQESPVGSIRGQGKFPVGSGAAWPRPFSILTITQNLHLNQCFLSIAFSQSCGVS